MKWQEYALESPTRTPDGSGGYLVEYQPKTLLEGIMDYLSGDNGTSVENRFIEDSTHVLVTRYPIEGVTDTDRIKDRRGRVYAITLVDNPADQDHHAEIYLRLQHG